MLVWSNIIRIIPMGQQCCSDEKIDNRVYHHSRIKPKPNIDQDNQPSLAYEAADRDYKFVRNFSPVDIAPRTHHIVEEIEEKLKPFAYSHTFELPVGTKDPSAYAVNNVGLIYDANSEWQDGLPHGKGRLIYPDGSCYTGSFIKGVPSGQGRFTSSQGWYYEGELFKQQAQGKGVFSFEKIGYRYQGQWEGDLPNGKGKESWAKAAFLSVYEGEYVAGKKHGRGKYKTDDWEYEGEFSNNDLTASKGIMKYKNGEIYEGGFINGKKHGFGIYKWKDGSFYEGWYSEDRKEGHGKFTSSDGKKFEGQWLAGKREGRGLLIVGDKKYPGEWHNDLPSSSKNFS